MSVVISYYNDRFSLILTDRMITSYFGTWQENKLYDIHHDPYGVCAGVGLETGIFAVRDLLSSPIEFNDEAEIRRFITKKIETTDITFQSYTTFSVGLTVLEADGIKFVPVNFMFSVCGADGKFFIGRQRINKNEFHILYPTTYLNNSALYNEFIANNSLIGDDHWSLETVLTTAKRLFNEIQQHSSSEVSHEGDFGILRYNKKLGKFKTYVSRFNDKPDQHPASIASIT